MKTLTFAAALAVSASAATANNLDVVGYTQYEFEAERFETGVGVEYSIDRFSFTPVLKVANAPGQSLDFDGVDIGVDYQITDAVVGYTKFEFDGDFDYEEFTVGVSFRF
jgi:hypothetical protein